jgi:hypothetical protein
LTPQIIPIFEQVLSPPEEQLGDDTRHLVKQAVRNLHGAHPELFNGHEAVLKYAA